MIATMKKVTIDNHNEDLVNFAQTIDFSELFNHVKTFAGVTCSFYQPEITTNQGRVWRRHEKQNVPDLPRRRNRDNEENGGL